MKNEISNNKVTFDVPKEIFLKMYLELISPEVELSVQSMKKGASMIDDLKNWYLLLVQMILKT